jgi:hypothetical protein
LLLGRDGGRLDGLALHVLAVGEDDDGLAGAFTRER